MDYRDSAEEAEYRAGLRAWLADNVPPGHQNATTQDDRAAVAHAWHKKLYEGGYIGQSWPVEWGGKGLSPAMDAILNEETGNFNAPPLPGTAGYIGRALQMYGTDEQRTQLLPPTISGDIHWCQGFSEPSAGSDLAALRTRAVRDGDEYVVNGHKMWTSGGQYSDWCLLLARTDPDVPKHKGISAFLVDMRSPGITVQPIVLADGSPETSEVFWDDVRIPANQRLGDEGEGWRIAMTTVSYERGPSDIGFISTYRKNLAELEETAAKKGLTDDRETQARLARAYVLGEVLRLNVLQQLSLRISGRPPGEEGSISKQLWTHTEQELQHLALDLFGADVVTGRRPDYLHRYFMSRPISVYGGSSQIQKNIIAQRLLEMPRK
ncbi:acyl-CoA dehydrogenase family protein [Kribbella solani]|uniref:Alkylation response protein AidB-like acyl-CoA dehydrogenase n=1 Tax=Kribbella solani TaxID=236067 RepID=A0A841DFN3_9ACTN|nr:acyl-CoA dehydrogenase family protein [Kribbella solani]MBB5977322.1 alkylation response protein AidB-like acyl-CoA dehydrogenase [Kribbella solani]